ncbi:MAG: hypothetical protein KatS3mg077_3291 [Candidatus Binatia bacterium]|nr:MAG: hypothetical protein KatS3mg077_3291 [Candidatus Binatia bacterium]
MEHPGTLGELYPPRREKTPLWLPPVMLKLFRGWAENTGGKPRIS